MKMKMIQEVPEALEAQGGVASLITEGTLGIGVTAVIGGLDQEEEAVITWYPNLKTGGLTQKSSLITLFKSRQRQVLKTKYISK